MEGEQLYCLRELKSHFLHQSDWVKLQLVQICLKKPRNGEVLQLTSVSANLVMAVQVHLQL